MMTKQMTPAAASGDADLVNASLAGDREAFGLIVSRYQSLICAQAYSATGSLSQSEDLAQETFFAAWKRLADLREPEKLRAWLCGIARNLTRNAVRAEGREPSHRADPLEAIPEAISPEPLPVERVISREEADILWRALERIPDLYREPLVLFYREHQSVDVVAQGLELTEETVRQRLSRGRKLLHEEIQAFVETALEQTAPGKTFTLAVVAGLPLAATTAKAASIGTAVAKGGAAAKGALALGSLGSLLAMIGAAVFSWKTAVDETRSPRERRFMIRTGWFQIGFLVVTVLIGCYWLPSLSRQPLYFGIVFSLLLLANLINAAVTPVVLGRRHLEIGMEEGTLMPANSSASEKEIDRMAWRKSAKLMIPFLLMLTVGSLGLPWKQQAVRCAGLVVVEILVLVWAFRRFQCLHRGQIPPSLPASRWQRFLRQPVVILPATVVGAALVGGLIPLYLNPGAAKLEVLYGPLRNLGWCLLAAILGYTVFLFVWKRKSGLIPPSLRDWIPQTSLKPEAIVEKTYAPIFQQLALPADQATQIRDLILQKTQGQVRHSLSLMTRKLDPTRRAELNQQLQIETDQFDAQMRQVIGEENYPAFQRFELSVPDRTMIDKFKAKLAPTTPGLSTEQTEQLLQALIAARAQFPFSTDLSRRKVGNGGYTAAFSREQITVFAGEEEEFDRQFLDRAGQVLNPEQRVAFARFQASHRKSQINGFKWAGRLVGS
jgi:RNA polymerase sigma factor (sigma-70 family)